MIPPPSLHLMLGIVGDLQTLLLSEWPEAIEWSNSLNVWPEEGGPRNRYRGEDCNILLKNVDISYTKCGHFLMPSAFLVHLYHLHN